MLLGACSTGPERQGFVPLDPMRLLAIVPGMSAAALRETLGPPAERSVYPNLREQVWSWRYRNIQGEAMMFNAHLDAAGSVLRHTSSTPEFVSSREGMD